MYMHMCIIMYVHTFMQCTNVMSFSKTIDPEYNISDHYYDDNCAEYSY